MEISYNFLSLVAIGNFNPAILSPTFLKDVCQLDLGTPTKSSPQEVPVIRALKFDELDFIVEFNRLQIKKTGIKDISKTNVLDIFRTYYNKLPFTPIRVVGVNINCSLVTENKSEIESLPAKMKDYHTFLDFFGANEIDVNEKFLANNKNITWKFSNYRIDNVKGLARLISLTNIRDDNGSYNINYNYETGNLTKTPSDLDLLLDGFDKFCDEFRDFLKYLEG